MSWLNMVPDWVFGEKKSNPTSQTLPMSGAPIGRPMGYTGNGGDGKIQTSMPTSMVQTTNGPLMLHEGEGTMQNKDGSVTVVPQKDLLSMQKGLGIPGMETGGTFIPAGGAIGTPKPQSNDDFLKTGMTELSKQATGQSPIFKSQENIANQNLGGASLAAIGAAKQQAAQSGLDKQGIGQVAQQTSRALEGERSALQGQIAQNKQQMASSAASSLANMAIGAKSSDVQDRSMNLQEKTYSDTKAQSDWERMLQYYDPASESGLKALQSAYVEKFGGTAPDMNTLIEQRKYTQQKQQQDLAAGNKSLTAQDIANVGAQLNVDATKATNVINAINAGATKDYISQAFGVNLTDEQYNSMQVKYSQSIKAGTISLTSGELQNQAASLGIDAQKMQNAITAINAGGSKQYVESLIGRSLTNAEFNSMRQKYLQEIKMGDLTITSQDLANVSSQLGIDVNRSQAVIDAVNNGATLDYVNRTYGTSITPEQFNSLQKKYYQSITAGDMELESLKTKVGDEKFASTVNRITAGASLDTINSSLGINLSKEEYNQMFEASETYFKKQGLTMEQASLYGYKDESGNMVPGSLQNAATQLGLQAKELDNQTKELFGYTDASGNYKQGKYDLLSEENKRAADQLYGYDVKDANGNVIGRVSGSLELQNQATDIQKQGLSLEEAQIKGYIDPKTGQYVKGSVALANEKQGLEVSSLYGYSYDPATGQIITDPQQIASRSDLVKVDGSLALAQKQFGLQSSTFDLQRMELMGGINSQGQYVPGKLELMSNEDKRAANQMYGYDETLPNGTIVHRSGTMEIAKDELYLKEKGLSIQEAQLYGYDKADGTHVSGAMEIESKKLDLLYDEYEAQKSSAAGESVAAHFSLMSNTKGYDYRNDEQARSLLQSYWEQSTGSTEPFSEEWAERQFEASSVTAIDAAMNKLESSSWFNDLDSTLQTQLRETTQLAAMLSVTGGLTPVYDENGAATKLVDSEGDTIWNLKQDTSQQGISAFNDWKEKNLLESDTKGFTDSQVYDIYYKIVANNQTPNRFNMLEALEGMRASEEQTVQESLNTYESLSKTDPRIAELESKDEVSATLWTQSGAKTVDEYLNWKKEYDRFGTTSSDYSIKNNVLVGKDGNTIPVSEYTNILKNGNDPNSPNYETYISLVASAPSAANITLENKARNTLSNPFSNGDLISMDGRLLYVESSGRFTKGGRDADYVVIVDVATGQKKQFSGGSTNINAGAPIKELHESWVKTLGV